jgi:hypothetical protein
MLYSLNVNQLNGNQNYAAGSIPTVTGYALALGKASAPERAFTAGRLVLGWLALIAPRVTQAARLARVSDPYVDAALAILRSGDPGLEAAVLRRELSPFEAAVLAKHPQPTLARKFMSATPAERADLARTAGPAVIWDELIAPHI